MLVQSLNKHQRNTESQCVPDSGVLDTLKQDPDRSCCHLEPEVSPRKHLPNNCPVSMLLPNPRAGQSSVPQPFKFTFKKERA